ncbi:MULTISPECIES: hypothetical protein [Streptomyces]|nr:hypothetical protein [Streptomyces sp. NBRC 13847]
MTGATTGPPPAHPRTNRTFFCLTAAASCRPRNGADSTAEP